jgi:hypothetical protein
MTDARTAVLPGSASVAMFSSDFFPMDPVWDGAGLWDEKEMAAIRDARHVLRKRFPQIRFYVETVTFSPEVSLPLYGFWRINTAPLAKHETHDHRSWSVLLVIDAASARASVTCGYRIGHWVGDSQWQSALEGTRSVWAQKGSSAAVIDFLKQASVLVRKAWSNKFVRKD